MRLEELNRIVAALTTLVNNELKRAAGPEGQEGDIELLVFTARAVANLYQEALEWVLRIRRVVAEDGIDSLVSTMDNFGDDIIEKLEILGPTLLRKLEPLDEAIKRGSTPPPVEIALILEFPGVNRFKEIADEIQRRVDLLGL